MFIKRLLMLIFSYLTIAHCSNIKSFQSSFGTRDLIDFSPNPIVIRQIFPAKSQENVKLWMANEDGIPTSYTMETFCYINREGLSSSEHTSLWNFWRDDDVLTSLCGYTTVIIKSVRMPAFLQDLDFEFIDRKRSGLLVMKQGGEVNIVSGGAELLCGGEGRVTATFTQNYDSSSTSLHKTSVNSGDCLYKPYDWDLKLSATTTSGLFVIACINDLTIKEQVFQNIVENDFDYIKSTSSKTNDKGIRLSKLLPPSMVAKSPILWNEDDPISHLLQYYYYMTRTDETLQSFRQHVLVDRILLSNLVDCSKECEGSLAELFNVLDVNKDKVLNQLDLMNFTLKSWNEFVIKVDELLAELKDFGDDQWIDLKEIKQLDQAFFLSRNKERQILSAQENMRRWVDGELSSEEERRLQRQIPDLSEEVLEARRKKYSEKHLDEL